MVKGPWSQRVVKQASETTFATAQCHRNFGKSSDKLSTNS